MSENQAVLISCDNNNPTHAPGGSAHTTSPTCWRVRHVTYLYAIDGMLLCTTQKLSTALNKHEPHHINIEIQEQVFTLN